ncbi:MAG: translesion DNA synthesis-associated protein ImuA [Gammaproteobacteria bacterium]|nr:translesion DNA synthesis-associated protein ImuA [Gammaproteobacteria bacterium]
MVATRVPTISAGLDKLPQGNPALWRGRDGDNSTADIKTGFAALDAALPGGGWPAGALTEILCEPHASGALRLLMPALARVHGDGRCQAWIAPPFVPYAPALAAVGIDLAATILIYKPQAADALWSAEQLLRSGLCNAVLLWPKTADFRALRRLQLAAEQGDCRGVVFRGVACAAQPSPAALRLRLCALGDEIEVQILKARGGLNRQNVRLKL